MNYLVEKPKNEEVHQLLSLCAQHAAFEKCDYDPAGRRERLSKDIFSSVPKLHCRVAIFDGIYIGYITWMKQYSTWNAAEYLYMDCLFLDDKYWSNGIEVALVNEIKKFGKENDINGIQWQTPVFNERAIKFYRRIGAAARSKERFFLDIKC